MNKKILTSCSIDELELESEYFTSSIKIISVTQNCATDSDINFLAEESIKNKDVAISKEKELYELWLNKEIIGCCCFEIDFIDPMVDYVLDDFESEEDYNKEEKFRRKELNLYTDLKFIYIKEKFRGLGLGVYFAEVIREDLNKTILAHFNFLEYSGCKKLIISAEALYYSQGGSMVHNVIHQHCDNYIVHLLKNNYNIDVIYYMNGVWR
jgi:hypothetical protein